MKFLALVSIFFVILAAMYVINSAPPTTIRETPSPIASTTSNNVVATTSQPIVISPTSATTTTKPAVATTTPKKAVNKPKNAPVKTRDEEVPVQVTRVESPYATAPKVVSSLDATARGSLVNILCMPKGGTLRPVSGSGVLIDSRGVILTNAHVAQFVLLSEDSQIDLDCTIRTGSPAVPKWKAKVLFIPPIWVNTHFADINSDHAMGTGEHDYALLLITSDMQGTPATAPLPFLPVDARQNIAFESDNVLGAGYPAEFVGGLIAQQSLYAVTSVSTIKQLMTFGSSTVDVFSVGSVIEAQGGSSGGPIINAWGFVIGIISTTSAGATTADRELHALSLSYIDRDMLDQTGLTLGTYISGDLQERLQGFSREIVPGLIQKYVSFLSR